MLEFPNSCAPASSLHWGCVSITPTDTMSFALLPFSAEGRICSTFIPTQKALPTASREVTLKEDQKR